MGEKNMVQIPKELLDCYVEMERLVLEAAPTHDEVCEVVPADIVHIAKRTHRFREVESRETMSEKGTEDQWHLPIHAEFANLYGEHELLSNGFAQHKGVYVDEDQWYVIDELIERIRIFQESGDLITFKTGHGEHWYKLRECLDRLKAGTTGH